MTHYKSMMETEFVGAWDLAKDVTVTIAKVEAGRIKSRENPKGDKKPIIWFQGAEKPFAANVTNCKTIAGMYGTHIEKWIGKRITLFATTCQGKGGEQVECVRIRPQIPAEPRARGAQSAKDAAPVDEAKSDCPECDGTVNADCALCFGTGRVSP